MSRKAAPKEMSLEATAEDRQRFCSRDVLWQIVPDTRGSNRKSLCYRSAVVYGPSKFYTAGIGIFDLFCSCDLDLDPMTLTYKLDPYFLEIYRMANRLCTSYVKAFESYRLTDRHDCNYIPRRSALRWSKLNVFTDRLHVYHFQWSDFCTVHIKGS